MSQISNSQGTGSAGEKPYSEEHYEAAPKGIAFMGEKTDLRYDPSASVKKTWVNSRVKARVDDQAVTFGAKEIRQVKKDLEFLNEQPAAVQKVTNLYPAFLGYAQKQGVEKPDAFALAVEHYAATNEFIKNMELEQA